LTKPTQFKIGIVNVREGKTPTKGETFFEMRYIDPPTGKEVRRRVSGLSHEKVCEMAANLTVEAYEGRGYLKDRPKAPTLGGGLLEAIQLSRAAPKEKKDLSRSAELFVAYMASRFPAVRTWGDLRPSHVEGYVRELETKGRAFDTIRNRLKPVKAAWRRMFADWPELVRAPAKIRTAAQPKREIECLDPVEVATLLDWLKGNRPNLWPMACLQGLAGLRGLEASSLRAEDVDFARATVTVRTTPLHPVKTAASERTLPVCGEIVAALRATATGQRLKAMSGELFLDGKGSPWKTDSLSHRWIFTLRRAARDLGLPRLAAVPPRKLRAAFATMAGRLGASDRILKAYLGHTPRDVLGGHYRRIGPDELASVSEAMDGWRETLIEAPRRKDSGNIPESVGVNA